MLLVDLEQGRLIPDDEIKADLAESHPYRDWLDRTQIVLEELPHAPVTGVRSNLPLLDRQQAFGYTQEDISILMTPMAAIGEEATGSMGNDTPISALSDKPKLLFTYFKQNFAQVTNPPIDPIREELVMSLVSIIGPRAEPVRPQGPGLDQAARSAPADPDRCGPGKDPLDLDLAEAHFRSRTLDTTYDATLGAAGLEQTLDNLCARAESEGRQHHHPLGSQGVGRADRYPLPAGLRRVVHHHLIRTGLRTSVGLVVEIRRAARGASLRLPRRLRRRGDRIPISPSRPSSR